MSAWLYELSFGTFMKDFAAIGVLLIVATILRRYVPFFQRFLVPNNIIAGFVGFFIANFHPPFIDFESERMGVYVYHLLSLTFIGAAMCKSRNMFSTGPMITGIGLVFYYLLQGILGLLITFFLIQTVTPDLFPAIGLLMPLAFGMGPGISYSIAQNWQEYGFTDGGVTGLTLAAVGFLIAYIGGILIIKLGIKKGLATYIKNSLEIDTDVKRGLLSKDNRPIAGNMTTALEAIEALTFHFALIGLAYSLTYGLLKLLSYVLTSLGAASEINTIWSFHFIFSAIIAISLRNILDRLNIGHLIDEGLMTRSANLFMDFMITASIIGISYRVVVEYALPIVVLSAAVGLMTYYIIKVTIPWMFKDHHFERFVSIFANATGTIQASLILLRILDPKAKSSAGMDLILGSGVALVFGFPLIALLNAPMNFFDNEIIGYYYVLLAMVVYALVLLFALKMFRKGSSS
jgi:ESS family glutamate:Na+ symporter